MGAPIESVLLSAHDNDGCQAENAASAYRLLLLIRRFEEKAGQLYALGLIPDEIKLCIGREALIAGVIAARQDTDRVIFGPRCHGALLALGLAPSVVMNELANPMTGLLQPHSDVSSGGKMCPRGFYRCTLDSAGCAGWAISLGMAHALKRDRNVVFVVLDGDSGVPDQLTRAISFAKRLRLPIVFIVDHAAPEPEPAKNTGPGGKLQSALMASAVSFMLIDGIDLEKVRAASRLAGDRARSDGGPQGLLISTQAFRGHASQPTSAPTAYSQPVHDPVLIARKRLLETVEGGQDAAIAIESDIRTTLTAIGQEIRASRLL